MVFGTNVVPFWIRRTVRGSSIALLTLCMTLSSSAKTEGIDPALLAKARSGDPVAEYRVGVSFANGKGVSEDHAQAAEWFRRAAEQGFRNALKELGKAAQQGDAKAQSALGYLYLNGKGIGKDAKQASDWFYQAIMNSARIPKHPRVILAENYS